MNASLVKDTSDDNVRVERGVKEFAVSLLANQTRNVHPTKKVAC